MKSFMFFGMSQLLQSNLFYRAYEAVSDCRGNYLVSVVCSLPGL